MNSICIITFQPTLIYCDFLNLFSKYKIFIVVDDNDYDLSDFINNYKNITFIKIENKMCELNGYKDANYMINKLISGWDKALYYFGVVDKNYDKIWFMEDDVFFYNEDTIIQIDNQYINDDLLSNTYTENRDGNPYDWHWGRIHINFTPPYYQGMMCAVRFSKNMLKCINEYVILHNTLFFLEALFPIIAIKNNLKYSIPVEFSNIVWRNDWKLSDIKCNNLYHPIKDIAVQCAYRAEITQIKPESL